MKSIKNYFTISPKEIALAGIFASIIIVGRAPFFNINFGIMQVGFSYVWLILAGLIFKPVIGVMTVMIGDNLGFVLWGNIGFWYWAYFIIPPMMFSLVYFLKNIYKVKNNLLLSVIGWLIFIVIFSTIAIMIIIKEDFVKKSGSVETSIDLSSLLAKILLWTMIGLLTIYQLWINYMFMIKKTSFWRDWYITSLIVSIVIVIMIWIYGPFANVMWLTFQQGKHAHTNFYWSIYDLYQIPRILKTPIILPIYCAIIIPIYKIIHLKINLKNSWS